MSSCLPNILSSPDLPSELDSHIWNCLPNEILACISCRQPQTPHFQKKAHDFLLCFQNMPLLHPSKRKYHPSKNPRDIPNHSLSLPPPPFPYTYPICHLDLEVRSPKYVKSWIIYIYLSGYSSIQTTIIFSLDYDKLAEWVSLLPFLPSHDPLSTEQPK